jgi:hypothetical protein
MVPAIADGLILIGIEMIDVLVQLKWLIVTSA